MTVESSSPKQQTAPLLETRFFSPPLPASIVHRPRLLERLNQGLELPLTLISASAGFGKSTLVSAWIRRQSPARASWLTLEPTDNEWGSFFRYFISAWQKIFPKVGETALAELQSVQSPPPETLVNSFLNDLLSAQNSDAVSHAFVVLDDYHRIEAPPIHDTVKYLIEHLPARCHLVLITRADPPFPLARWRSHRLLLELRAEDLRFTPPEAAAFLNQSMELELLDEQIEVLEARTEGWIVGLQMAALSLRGREDAEEFVRSFGGSHRYVLDYLIEEVVSQQTEDVKNFLFATAPLEQFCAPLCDAVLEANLPYSQGILEHLERANLFLIALDDQRHWFRYHHLFADLLRVRFRQSQPEQFPNIYRRAARWFGENKLWREALRYAALAQDDDLGLELFEQALLTGGLDFLFSGMRPLVEPFPPDLIQDRPLLSLAKSMSMIEQSQLDGIQSLLRAAERGIQSEPPFEQQPEVLGMIFVVQSVAASLLGDSAWILEASRRVTELLPDNIRANVNALIQLGNVYFYQGDLRRVDECWSQALDLSQGHHYPYGILSGLDDLGRLCCHTGELERAEMLFQRALELMSSAMNSPRWLGATQRDYSDLLRERNHLAEARAMMASSIEISEQWDMVSGRGLGHIHMGRILLAQGDLTGAACELEKSEQLRREHTLYPDLDAIILVFRARLLMERNELDRAWTVLEAGLQSPCCQHEFHREWLLIASARVLLRQDRPDEALALLKTRLEAAWENRRGRNWLEICLLTALGHEARGEHAQAFARLQEALDYGRSKGFFRIFVDEGEPLRNLLERFKEHFPGDMLQEYVTQLLAVFPVQASGEGPTAQLDMMIEPLTARELEVLCLVCEGLSNQEIAARLVLSVGTVKTHIHHIFGKLGVSNRPQAIARAGKLGFG